MKNLIEKFNNLPPDKKRILLLGSLGVIIIGGIYLSSQKSTQKVDKPAPQPQGKVVITPTGGKELLQTRIQEQEERMRKQEEEIQRLRALLEKQEQMREQKSETLPPSLPPPPPPATIPPPNTLPPPPPSLTSTGQAETELKPKKQKDISIIGKEEPQEEVKEKKESKENKEDENSSQEERTKKKTIYLPSGTFVKGKLITGGDFPASDFVKANPYPVLIRLTDLAILPNDVKGNLKGCFIIAEGFGDLAAERAYIRPVYLSCLDWEGNAVIDQKVKGFIADSDGKLGIRGRVVSKMGSVLARVAISGFIEGLGKGLSDVLKNKDTFILPQGGAVQRTNEEDIVKVAAGEGVSSAAKQLSQFYLALAQQTVPVVEVNAVRDVYVVITEGNELEIKSVNKGIWNKGGEK